MKVIFLDFDGVLNSFNYAFENDDEGALDRAAVARVNRIIERTGAVVCLSTAWRHHHTFEELKGFLTERGFNGTIVDVTPSQDQIPRVSPYFSVCMRGDEVQAWLSINDVESFVVLDDLDEFHMMRDRHIMTDPNEGLLDHHVERAVEILSIPVSDEDEVPMR